MKSPHLWSVLGISKRRLLPAIPIAILLTVGFAVVFSARRALNYATQAQAREGQMAFTLRSLDASTNLARSLGSETVAATPSYTSGVFLLGDLYLGGQSGLTVAGADGTARLSLRAGFELPAAPIDAMATGRVRGSSGPQLLIATRGAGLLLLEPGPGAAPAAQPSIRQLLPAEAEARDLTALLPLKTGDVLLGTRRRGVLIYNGATLVPLHFTLPGTDAASLQITALAAVDSASFLIGTRNSGVFYVHGGTVDRAGSGEGLPDDQVESIAVSGNRAFVGTPTGIGEFDLSAALFRPVRTVAQGVFSHALAVDEQGLTVGTLDQGIALLPLENGPHLRRVSISAGPAVAPQQRVDAFLTAPDGLYALADGGLLRRNGAAWTPALAAEPRGLTDPNISALAFAPDGTLYVGFFDRGIDLLSPDGGLRHIEDDHLFCINRLVLDPERHTIAAATANGLVLFDAQGRPRQTLTRRDGLISDHVTDVSFTRNGTALATPAGITFLGQSGAESLYAFQGLVNNHVYALASSGNGQLLAGTLGGISILKEGAVERTLTVTNSALKHNWITALLPVPDSAAAGTLPTDTMLVGTYGAGLEALDGQGRFTPIELPAGTPRDLVINPNALYATSSHIYAGTLGNGMLVYSLSSGRWSAVTSGLPSLNVTAFAGRGGEIYVGTENGLVRIREANLP